MKGLPKQAAMLGMALTAALLAPVAMLPIAALVDRDSAGSAHATLFHVALAVWDPFVSDCIARSVTVAVIVAVGSLVIGVGLGGIAGRWQFWGKRSLWGAAWLPIGILPFCGAIGLIDGGSSWRGETWPWLALVWVELAWGVPRVAIAARSAWEELDPRWTDPARLMGAGRIRRFATLVWPVIRPRVAPAAAHVFALTLVEPGAPLVLGLRRTLASQIVESALEPATPARSAVLALIALALALAARTMILWWGGTSPPARRPAVARPRRASWLGALPILLGFGGWAVVAWLPVLGLVASVFNQGGVRSGNPSGAVAASWAELITDRSTRALLVHSLVLGVAVASLDLALAWLAARAPTRRGDTSPWRWFTAWPRGIPPLAFGVGALLVPWVAHLSAGALRGGAGIGWIAAGLDILGDWLDPIRSPWLLLVWGVAVMRLSDLIDAASRSLGPAGHEQVHAAWTLGASRTYAWRTITVPRWANAVGGAWLLTCALAATEVAPALVLTPTAASRPVGPGALLVWTEPGGRSRATVLAAGVVLVNLGALVVASRRGALARRAPAGDRLG